jgi:hypothetical protein
MQRNEPKKNQASPSRSRCGRARAAQKVIEMAFNAKRSETRPAPEDQPNAQTVNSFLMPINFIFLTHFFYEARIKQQKSPYMFEYGLETFH